jgi:hypothetical protein
MGYFGRDDITVGGYVEDAGIYSSSLNCLDMKDVVKIKG